MSEQPPREGDRVRVSYEARYEKDHIVFADGNFYGAPPDATVEVLPEPLPDGWYLTATAGPILRDAGVWKWPDGRVTKLDDDSARRRSWSPLTVGEPLS